MLLRGSVLASATLAVSLSAAAAAETCNIDVERQALLDRHAAVIEYHVTNNVEAWLAGEADEVVVGGGGEVFYTHKEERRAMRSDYLGRNDYSRYEDTETPIVEVAADCSIAWLIAEVAVAGDRREDDGSSTPFGFRSSWIELYKRIQGKWTMIGNVSDVVSE